MAAMRSTAIKARLEISVACPAHEAVKSGYGSMYNSINDDGGVRCQGAHPGVVRTAAVGARRGKSRVLNPGYVPSGSRKIRKKVITTTRHVFSVPGTTRGATQDTLNRPYFASLRHPAHSTSHATWTIRGAA